MYYVYKICCAKFNFRKSTVANMPKDFIDVLKGQLEITAIAAN